MYGELSRIIADLVKGEFPEIESVFRYNCKARVVSADREKGVATIHPLKPDGSLDGESPEIPDVPLPVIPAPSGAAYIVPDIGEDVRLCYYYDDPSQPKIVECLGKGHIYGDMYWESRENAHIEMKGWNIDIG